MLIANASGCSSVRGASAPSVCYAKNSEGKGPSWANSLFEDNAEYSYGMKLATDSNKYLLETYMKEFLELNIETNLNEAFKEWIENKEDVRGSKEATAKILNLKDEQINNEKAKEILENIYNLKNYLIKKSVWIFGGDGWAYDIGYGGVDHILASGENINILVFDT